ncbi:MAG: mercuric transport protein periplasmic component [Betaproteobacteria bacterium]|nr:MAG: mercuric transport protein periplasmic component [Betaproteobacteria bacterium]
MRRIFSVSAAALALAASVLAAEPARVVLDVPAMNCALCPVSVKKALERVPGVIEAKADLATKSAEAKYDPEKVSPEALARAVTNAGYPATPRK